MIRQKTMAATGRGLFSKYIYTEKFKNLFSETNGPISI